MENKNLEPGSVVYLKSDIGRAIPMVVSEIFDPSKLTDNWFFQNPKLSFDFGETQWTEAEKVAKRSEPPTITCRWLNSQKVIKSGKFGLHELVISQD